MNKKDKTEDYTIMAKVRVECDLTIKAESLEEALQQSRKLKVSDFVEIKGDYMDGELHINGLFEC